MSFNESQFIKLIFLLSDTQTWLSDLEKNTFSQLPLPEKKKLFKQSYYLSSSALAHIIERHYYKINRHPEAGKFHIELLEILHYIREAKTSTAIPVPGCNNMQRVIQTTQPIGSGRTACISYHNHYRSARQHHHRISRYNKKWPQYIPCKHTYVFSRQNVC